MMSIEDAYFNGGEIMHAKVTGPQLIIIISMVFVGLGLFTPLPYTIFSTLGVVGVLIGWLLDIKIGKEDRDSDNIDVDINVTDTHPVTFDERLRKLEQLKAENLISEEEYGTKRQQIMEDNW